LGILLMLWDGLAGKDEGGPASVMAFHFGDPTPVIRCSSYMPYLHHPRRTPRHYVTPLCPRRPSANSIVYPSGS
jgi:hypothetical protein